MGFKLYRDLCPLKCKYSNGVLYVGTEQSYFKIDMSYVKLGDITFDWQLNSVSQYDDVRGMLINDKFMMLIAACGDVIVVHKKSGIILCEYSAKVLLPYDNDNTYISGTLDDGNTNTVIFSVEPVKKWLSVDSSMYLNDILLTTKRAIRFVNNDKSNIADNYKRSPEKLIVKYTYDSIYNCVYLDGEKLDCEVLEC